MMRNSMLAALTAAGLGLALSTIAVAQQPAATRPAQAQRGQGVQPTFNDQLFAMAAAAGGLAEVSTGRLAAERATGDAVKQYAQRMVQDHTDANRQLIALAQAKGIALPQQLDIKDQAAAAILSGLRGAEFDREYAKSQVAAHLCAVQLFTAESKLGRDAELKALAEKLLPTLEDHLQQARQLAGEAAGG